MKKDWLIAPVLWFVLLAMLLIAWAVVEPAPLLKFFDQGGYSPFELATLPVFALAVPLVWWKCPFEGSKTRRTVLCTMVSVVAIMAIVKEADLHLWAIHSLFPGVVGNDGNMLPGLFKPNGNPLTGTPYKMRVLTNAGVPLAMKAFIVTYFIIFFGFFAAGFVYLLPTWVKGVFKLDACAWAWGCCGASGVVTQLSDRLPAWIGHAEGLGEKTGDTITAATSLCACIEEGSEMMLAIFALLTIYFGWKAATKKEQA